MPSNNLAVKNLVTAMFRRRLSPRQWCQLHPGGERPVASAVMNKARSCIHERNAEFIDMRGPQKNRINGGAAFTGDVVTAILAATKEQKDSFSSCSAPQQIAIRRSLGIDSRTLPGLSPSPSAIRRGRSQIHHFLKTKT